MNLYKSILVLILLIPISVYSQDYVLSIQIKSSGMNVQQFTNNKYSKSIDIYPLSIYLGNKFRISENYQIEISPGYFFGGENFSGFEAGVYFRRNIYNDKIFGALGFNLHYNLGSSHGINVVEDIPNGIFLNIGASIGLNLNKTVSFLLSFIKTISEDYGYTSVVDFEGGLSKKYQRNLFSIIQVGFEFNF